MGEEALAKEKEQRDTDELELTDQVIYINRVTKVVKGGKNLSFTALVVVGDGRGHVGYGLGKAREVPQAISKGIQLAKKKLIKVPLKDTTIYHTVLGEFSASRVLMRPASPGTGIIAGGAVRVVLELCGVKDVLAKSIGSNNPNNVVKATFDGLLKLKDPETVSRVRGKDVIHRE
jgi:small subunit ribosomal protein S5